MKKILVPTDFSAHASAALDTAIIIAKKAAAEIILLHVVETPSSGLFNVEGEMSSSANWEDKLFTMKLIEKSRDHLSLLGNRLTEAGVGGSQELRMGNPFQGISSIITDHKVDLVVMGTEGHTKLEKMLIGSTTEKVVRHAQCPVLTIHEKMTTHNFKNIVYATSMIQSEDEFVTVVKELQVLFDATIHVVWINKPSLFEPELVVRKSMQSFANRLKLRNYTLNMFCDYSEEEGILNFAESINANLIMMATHGRTGIARILAGSVAEKVSTTGRTPVLTRILH